MSTIKKTVAVRFQPQDIERLDQLRDVLGTNSRISTVRALMDAAPAHLAVQNEIRKMADLLLQVISTQDEKLKVQNSITVEAILQLSDEVSSLRANVDRSREATDEVNRYLMILTDAITD